MAANRSVVVTGHVERNEYHVSGYPYREVVQSLNKGVIITMEDYKHCELFNYFDVDRVNLYKNGRPNPDHVFEIFGNLSNHTSAQVRVLTLQAIAANVPFYKSRSTVCLGMRDNYFEGWLSDLADQTKPCDELGLLTLSYLYRRHTVVYTASKLWSTLECPKMLSLLEVLNECQVKLLYLGDLQFGSLKPHLHESVPKLDTSIPTVLSVSTRDASTSRVETIEEDRHVETNGDSNANTTDSVLAEHVETSPAPVPTKAEHVTPSTSPAHQTESDTNTTTEEVIKEEVTSILEPGSYLFLQDVHVMQDVHVNLTRLSPSEITKWTESSSAYRLRNRKSRSKITGVSLRHDKALDYRPQMSTSKSKDKTATGNTQKPKHRPRASGPTSARIRANQLIVQAKNFHTKPVMAKHSNSDVTANEDLQTPPTVSTPPVETDQNVSEHVETDGSLTEDYTAPVPTGSDKSTDVTTGTAKPKKGKVNIKSYV